MSIVVYKINKCDVILCILFAFWIRRNFIFVFLEKIKRKLHIYGWLKHQFKLLVLVWWQIMARVTHVKRSIWMELAIDLVDSILVCGTIWGLAHRDMHRHLKGLLKWRCTRVKRINVKRLNGIVVEHTRKKMQ